MPVEEAEDTGLADEADGYGADIELEDDLEIEVEDEEETQD